MQFAFQEKEVWQKDFDGLSSPSGSEVTKSISKRFSPFVCKDHSDEPFEARSQARMDSNNCLTVANDWHFSKMHATSYQDVVCVKNVLTSFRTTSLQNVGRAFATHVKVPPERLKGHILFREIIRGWKSSPSFFDWMNSIHRSQPKLLGKLMRFSYEYDKRRKGSTELMMMSSVPKQKQCRVGSGQKALNRVLKYLRLTLCLLREPLHDLL